MTEIAFYPCCATDFSKPLSLLSNRVDTIVFCDLRKPSWNEWSIAANSSIDCEFLHGDARIEIENINKIDIYFYRQDGFGEGGSGIGGLTKKFLPKILARFREGSGTIITDGSTCAQGRFKRMRNQKNGIVWLGYRFK